MSFYNCVGCKKRLYDYGNSDLQSPCADCTPPTEDEIKEWWEDGTDEDNKFRCPWCTETFDEEMNDVDKTRECPMCEKPVDVEVEWSINVCVKRRIVEDE